MDKLKAARQAATEAKKAFDANPSEETAKAVEEATTKFMELHELDQRAKKANGQIGAILDGDVEEGLGEVTESKFGLASKFIESPEYKSFTDGLGGSSSSQDRVVAIPSMKLGSYAEVIEQKDAARLTTGLAQPTAVRYPMIDQTIKPELTLMDLVSKGRVNSNSIDYVQIVAITRNAALQPENTGNDATDVLKPISDMATNLETAKVFGYADGYVVTTQMLADAAAFASFMDNELRTSIRAVQERYLLNGSGENGEPRGILNTTGIQQDSYDASGSSPVRNLVEKVRTGVRKVREKGGQTSAVLLHPEDNEAIDLMKDANGNYIFGGPAQVGAQTLWGQRRVVSEEIPKGTVLLGDFNQIAYLDRDGISVQAFNQHKDFAQRNLVYVRAEARGLQAIWRPARLLLLEAA